MGARLQTQLSHCLSSHSRDSRRTGGRKKGLVAWGRGGGVHTGSGPHSQAVERSRGEPLAQAGPRPTPMPIGNSSALGRRPQSLGPHDLIPTADSGHAAPPPAKAAEEQDVGEKRLCGVTPGAGNVLGNILFQPETQECARQGAEAPWTGPRWATRQQHRCNPHRGLPEPTRPGPGAQQRNWPLGPWPCRLCCLPAPRGWDGPSSCLLLIPPELQTRAAPRPDTQGRAEPSRAH